MYPDSPRDVVIGCERLLDIPYIYQVANILKWPLHRRGSRLTTYSGHQMPPRMSFEDNAPRKSNPMPPSGDGAAVDIIEIPDQPTSQEYRKTLHSSELAVSRAGWSLLGIWAITACNEQPHLLNNCVG